MNNKPIPFFKRFVIQNFPFIEEDFDALTNYQLFCKVVEYLNTVIGSQNEVTQQMEHVLNYFNTLDVQDEINNKLDQMAENGTLTNLISAYVQPYIDNMEADITEISAKTDQYNQKSIDRYNDLANRISLVETISPTVVTSTAAMTDTSKIYVLTTDNNWYYYDGDSWEVGGSYSSADLVTKVNGINTFLDGCGYLTFDGGYIKTDGTIEAHSSWKHSNEYLPLLFIKGYTVPAWSSVSCVAFYDENKSFISGLHGTGAYYDTHETITKESGIPSNAKYIRISLRIGYEGDFTISKSLYNIEPLIADVEEKVEQINPDLGYADDNKYINTSGVLTELGRWGHTANFVPISRVESVSVPLWGGASCVAFYDSNKNFIRGISGNAPYYETHETLTSLDVAPANAVYVKFSYVYISRDGTESYYPDIKLKTIDDLADNVYNVYTTDWRRKRCAFLGDSITYGAGTTEGNRYWEYLKGMIGINPFSYGVSGAKMSNLYSQATAMHGALGNNVDAIFIFAGTNDFLASTPLGEWYTTTTEDVEINSDTHATEERSKRTFVDSTSTFKGAINKLLSYLKNTYPTKQIIMMTPIHRGYAKLSASNIQYSELYSNSDGGWFEDYINTIKEACGIWSVPCIDLYEESGLNPLVAGGATYYANSSTDLLHPNASGHYRIAKTIAAKLNSINV